jgi:MtaA/CmuA family methyltransferase
MVSSRFRVLSALYDSDSRALPVVAVNQSATSETMKHVGTAWPMAHMKSDKMAALAVAGHLYLGFDNVRLPFDQTVEAEALGGKVAHGGELEFPEVVSSPFAEANELKVGPDVLSHGRIPVVLDAIAEVRRTLPCNAPIVAGIVGPFSVAAQTFGLERYLKWTIKDPDGIDRTLEAINPFLMQYAKEEVKRGADVISIEEMAASPDMLNPKFFRERVAKYLGQLISAIEAPVILHICGNATAILDTMVELKPAALSLDAKTDLAKAYRLAHGKVKLAGNLSPITTLLRGSPEDVKTAVERAVQAGVDMVAPGCSLSPLTPTANVKAMVDATRALESSRGSLALSVGPVEDIFVNYSVAKQALGAPSPAPPTKLDTESILGQIATAVVRGDVDAVKSLTRTALATVPPTKVIQEGLTAGIAAVGRLWDQGEYFLPEVITASDAMQEGIKLCESALGRSVEKKGKVIAFVAEGDIHDIGKNIVVSFLKAGGYDVVDLGKDVPDAKVIEAVLEHKPMLVCGTALMTTTMSAFPRIADALLNKGVDVPLAVGGGAVTLEFAESFSMGVYGERADKAIMIADLVREGKNWQQLRNELRKAESEGKGSFRQD